MIKIYVNGVVMGKFLFDHLLALYLRQCKISKGDLKMEKLNIKRFNISDYVLKEEMTVEQMKEEIKNLRYLNDILRYNLENRKAPFNNNACRGYVIHAMNERKISSELIKNIIDELKYSFDFITEEKAENIYLKSKY